MKDPNGFDELARQKLSERVTTFDESHWTDMERLLRERDRKPKAWWPWMTAGILLLGAGAVWVGMDEDPIAGTTVRTTVHAEPATAPSSTTVNEVPAADPEGNEEEGIHHAQVSGTGTELVSNEARTAAEPGAAHTTSSTRPYRTERTRRSMERESAIPTPRDDRSDLIASVAILPHAAPPTSLSEDPKDPVHTEAASSPNPTGPAQMPTTDIGSDTVPDEALTEEAGEAPAVIAATGSPDAPPTTDPALSELEADASGEAEVGPPTPVTTPEPPPVPPSTWLAIRTPFELSALGGTFSTSSEYTGDGTESWGASTERQTTSGFGLEGIWNLSDHFGIGAGAHISGYKERLSTEELSTTDQVLTNAYSWTSYDTLVLTVTGTDTIGAIVYNITELVPTTVYELDQTTDTSYVTTVSRPARTVTNTVSYVEVPLLFDAHTSCGRWVLGARGGPSLGFLTSRQGTVPGEVEGGYADFSDETFTSITFGCNARLYARYRLTRSWSVGVEPAWRQQLGNTFSSEEIQRRSNAVGAYFSLSYRILPKSSVP